MQQAKQHVASDRMHKIRQYCCTVSQQIGTIKDGDHPQRLLDNALQWL